VSYHAYRQIGSDELIDFRFALSRLDATPPPDCQVHCFIIIVVIITIFIYHARTERTIQKLNSENVFLKMVFISYSSQWLDWYTQYTI